MALNLSQGLRTLNTGGTTGEDALASDVEGSTQFGRGWRSAGLGGNANSLFTQSLKAEDSGDLESAEVLRQQAQDLQGQAAQWAPRVQNITDVRSLRDGADWLGGAAGNLRTSVAPALAGLAGTAVGSLAGPAGAVLGGFAGASAAGYDMETNEAVAQAMNDPYIRANHTPDEILAASRVKGGINAMLEAAVPTMLGGKLLSGAGVKSLARTAMGRGATEAEHVAEQVGRQAIVNGGWQGAGKAVGKEMLKEGAGEFATEGAQSLVGAGAQNYLQDQGITDFSPADYKQALNEGAAGAVAGHAMGAVGGMGEVLHARAGATADKVREIKADPATFIADKVADLGTTAGNVAAKGMDFIDRLGSSPHQAFDSLVGPGKMDPDVMSGRGMEWADHVLNNTKDYSDQQVADAKEFVLNPGGTAASVYRDKLSIEHHEGRQAADDAAISDEIRKRTGQGTKKSLMRGTLTDDFGEQEGRDSLDDTAMDDYGNLIGHTDLPYGKRATNIGGKDTKGGIELTVPGEDPAMSKGPKLRAGQIAGTGMYDGKTRQDAPAPNTPVGGEIHEEEAYDAARSKARVAEISSFLIGPDPLRTATRDSSAGRTQTQLHLDLVQKFGNDDVAKAYAQRGWTLPSAALKSEVSYSKNPPNPRQKLASVADIWRKQGVSEKLLAATSNVTDEAQRQSTIDMLGWVSRGFKDTDGNVFVPETLTKKYKDKAPKMIQSMAKLAFEQGLIGHAEARMTPDVMKLAQLQHADATAVSDGVIGAIPEYARTMYKPYVAEITDMLREAVAKGTTKKQEEALLSVFGSKEALAQAMSKLPEPKSKPHALSSDTESSGATGKATESDDLSYEDEHHENELTVGDGAKFSGKDEDNNPYDLKDEKQVEQLARDTKSGPARKNNTVGVWARVKSEFDAEPEGKELSSREEAEDELLEQYGQHFMKEKELAHLEEIGATKAEYLSTKYDGSRNKYLEKIDKRFVMVRNDAVSDGEASDTVTKDQVEAFAEDFDPRGPAALVSKGSLFLERTGLAGGFKTSAMRLARHTWFNGEKGAKVAPGVGLHGIYQDVLAAVGALMVADPRFTGRIGYKVSVGGETKWIEAGLGTDTDVTRAERHKANLATMPSDFKLPKGDLAAAKAQALESLKEGDSTRAVRFATTSREMYKALREFSQREGVSPKQEEFISNSLKQKFNETKGEFESRITALYRKFRGDDSFESTEGQTSGAKTGRGESNPDLTPSDIDTDESVQGMLRASDPVVPKGGFERDDTGRLKGGAPEAAQEGNARGGKVGEVRPGDSKGVGLVKSEPSLTEITPARLKALDTTERLKNWAFEKLRGGVPAFNAALKSLKLSDDHTGKLVAALGTLSKLAPVSVRKQFDKTLTNDQAAAIVKRATVALLNLEGTIPSPDAEGATNGNASRRPGVGADERRRAAASWDSSGQESSATANSVGVTPVPIVGQTSGTGNTGSLQAGVVAGASEVQRGTSGGVSDQRAGQLSTKSLDDAIYDEKYAALDSVAKLQQFAQHVSDRARELESREEAGEALSSRDEGISSIAGQLMYDAKKSLKNPDTYVGTDFESFFDGVEHTDADVMAFVKALAGSKQSTQTADLGTGARATKEQVAQAKQHILDTLGTSVRGAFVKSFGDNSSGSWTPGATINTIRIALNGDVLGTSYHESMHEFFSHLGKAGSSATQAMLRRVATNPLLNRRIEVLLAEHPEAAAQVRSDPDEAAAFMYQFWRAGVLKLGPETQTFFEKIKAWLDGLLGKVSAATLDAQHAEAIMAAFSKGALKEDSTREAILKAMNESSEAHEKALENLDKAGRDFTNSVGKLMFSAEAMLKGTKNKDMISIADGFHQEAGEAKGEKQGLLQATQQQINIWTNKLENILTAHDGNGKLLYTPEDLELARKALSSETPAKDRVAKEIVEKITKFNKDMFDYISSRGVSRWDDETSKWVPVEHRADYFRRVWNTDAVRNGSEKFRALLVEHHMKELTSIAKQANGEVTNNTTVDPDFASSKELKKPAGDRQTITPEMVADAIVARLLNANGQVELEESTSSIGMSPVATSVNRRSLSWIDALKFDDFLSKDMTNIMSGYVSSMVKRAEHTRVFGPGAEKMKAKADSAILREMGGSNLVLDAEEALPPAVKSWKSAKATWVEAGHDPKEFETPFPTLRSVGQGIHFGRKGQEQGMMDLAKATKDLEQGFKAIMAMEGTLGADISPALRRLNSSMATYQTVRLLPLVLFSSINDVMGIVANGGELNDAWNALVSGIKEIKMSWGDKKSQDYAAKRAEEWGAVEATTRMDNIGQIYGSMYMTGKARKLSNSFYKWVGMEGFNRGVRVAATTVAERAIKAYKTEGVDRSDPAAVARFETLFGKNFDPTAIALDANGELDTKDTMNQAAVMRWVSNAVMSPNAAHRTTWGSDTRMASLWMLKQFAYTFHRVMLKNALAQAKLGNYRPAMVLAVGYAPVAIAADAVKEMLVPGEDPPWMKAGLGGYLRHGVDRAGIFGVPGMVYDSASYDYGAGLLGPTLSQVAHVPFDSAAKSSVGALPFGGRLSKLVDD